MALIAAKEKEETKKKLNKKHQIIETKKEEKE